MRDGARIIDVETKVRRIDQIGEEEERKDGRRFEDRFAGPVGERHPAPARRLVDQGAFGLSREFVGRDPERQHVRGQGAAGGLHLHGEDKGSEERARARARQEGDQGGVERHSRSNVERHLRPIHTAELHGHLHGATRGHRFRPTP